MKFIKWNFTTIFIFMSSIKLSTAIFCMNWLGYANFYVQSFILQLKKICEKQQKLILSIYYSSLRILNLHRKSKYQQNKNIARFLKHILRALCSYFVDILIFYANLKFSMSVSSYWNNCHYFFHFLILSESNFLQSFLHFCQLTVTDRFSHVS